MSIPAQNSSLQNSQTLPVRIDFKWIGQAWELFKSQSGVWIGAVFLFFLVSLFVSAVSITATDGWNACLNYFTQGFRHPPTYQYPAPSPLVYQRFVISRVRDISVAGINAVFIGGLYRMALLQKRGEPTSVFGLFSAIPQSLPLFLVGSIIPTALALVEVASLWPLHHFLPLTSMTTIENVYLLIITLFSSMFLFAPLLVLDVSANVPEALLGSIRLLHGQLLRGIGFYLYASLVGAIGVIGCGIGMLATYPIFILSIATGYLALTQPLIINVPAFALPEGVWPPPPRVSQENQP